MIEVVDTLHNALEQQDVQTLLELTTAKFQKESEERGGLERYFKIVPPTSYPGTREVVDIVQTQNKRIILVEVTYISPAPRPIDKDELIIITDLIWQVREGNDWKIDKLFYLSASIESMGLVS